MSPCHPRRIDKPVHIREVWDANLDDEMLLIRHIVRKYPYVGMDTEFPGTVCRTITPTTAYTRATSLTNYASLKANVDMLNLIQLGLTFSDAQGNLPYFGTGAGQVWQFNFREFDLGTDLWAKGSIELLSRSGIDFDRFRLHGVDARKFANLLSRSGVLLNGDLRWVTFHAGYDFAYLLKTLTGRDLPDTRVDFIKLVKGFFPVLYDIIKHIVKFHNSLYGGLDRISEVLGVKRVGIIHQAGSDSLVTLRSFFKLKELYFGGSVDEYAGVLYGLDVDR